MENPEPRLAKRRLNKHSKLKSGRTIGERREHLETASERMAARKKVKKRQNLRVVITIAAFLLAAIAIIVFVVIFLKQRAANEIDTAPTVVVKTYSPTIGITDENSVGGKITARMNEYIGQLETDLRDLGLTPLRAVVPAGSIREVDIYLVGYNGFVKTTIDRGTGVTAEDTDRMIRYLKGQGINDFEYIDVRIDGKAYWK
ncbi:hypothetical protein IJG93_02480 [Candidatus Saccharibacteria bacterium]|nr:hypothetical protein [Candidatus Saccharibacteria bacterium]